VIWCRTPIDILRRIAPGPPLRFTEAARVLRPGGRLAIADIVSQRQLKHSIVCDADLWAACIGGAAQQDAYQELIENAGLAVTTMWRNDYEFISQRARDASARYGVKSISLLAVKSSGGVAKFQSPSSGSVQEAQSWQPSLIAPRLPQSRRPCAPVRR
jgi:hypothetical protein